MHISWPLGPLSLFFFLKCHFFVNSICLSLPFSVLVFILFVVGFREQLWKAHIYMLKYAEEQLSANKPDGAFSSEDLAAG